tara:strand:+ start:84 stop:254 length:171 start_codon:yes stop_codon:yes gene_type:complete
MRLIIISRTSFSDFRVRDEGSWNTDEARRRQIAFNICGRKETKEEGINWANVFDRE